MAHLFSSFFSNKEEKHEVFLSFRGEDTRKTFVSHLNAAFKRANIKIYKDCQLEKGDEIAGTLLKAIEDSQLSVIVFSENFANSKWCLDEVKKIMKCKKRRGQIVIPVFYHVVPTHVRNQTGSYANAFAAHERQLGHNPIKMRKMKKWKDALLNAANISGWSCSLDRFESEVVEDIVNDVLKKLDRVDASDLDEKIEKYQRLAKIQKEYYDATFHPTYLRKYQEAVEYVIKLQSERHARFLRTPPRCSQ